MNEDGCSIGPISGRDLGEKDPRYQDVSQQYIVFPIDAPPDERAPGNPLNNVASINSNPLILDLFDSAWANANWRRFPPTPFEGPDRGKQLFADDAWEQIEAAILYTRATRSVLLLATDRAFYYLAPLLRRASDLTAEYFGRNATRPLLFKLP